MTRSDENFGAPVPEHDCMDHPTFAGTCSICGKTLVITGQVDIWGDEPTLSPPCPNHREVQHRDGKPPWCDSCGWRHGRPATPSKQYR